MNNNHNHNYNSNHGSASLWHEYDPSQRRHDLFDPSTGTSFLGPLRIPKAATHLRIGFIQFQRLLDGCTSPPIEVEEFAFSSHRALRQVQIYLPVVSKIGIHAFDCCHELEQVEFVMKPPQDEEEEEQEDHIAAQSQLVSIGNFSFRSCRKLKSVIGLEFANESIQSIGDGAFDDCRDVNVDFLESLTRLKSLGSCAFQYNVTLTTVDLSKAVHLTELQSTTFHGCKALISVHLPPNLLKIGHFSFFRCFCLEEIVLPSKLQSIDKKAFTKCPKLKAIVLPPALKRIGWQCFHDCAGLTHIVLSSPRMPFLKKNVFNRSCTSVSALELPDPVPRQQWPLVLEQFCTEDGIASQQGSILSPKNRNSIVWNFLCQNVTQLFICDQ